jgi:capsular exopolysaccharide synthesis family protein
MKEISIKEVFAIIRRWIWLILAVALVVGLAAGIYYSGFVQDEYTAQTVLYVLQTYQDSTDQIRVDTGASTSFAADYKELLKTTEIWEQTALEVNLSGVGELQDAVKIDINAATGTRVLNVTVVGTDRFLCTNVANVISRIFVEMVSQKIHTNSLAIIADARVPEEPSGPPRTRNTALAAVIAGLACAGIVLFIALLNTRISTESQVEDDLKRPLLAGVSDYRKDVDRFIANNAARSLILSMPSQTKESIRTLAANIQFAESGRPIQSFTITSATPEEGKSSISLMVAQVLAMEGKQVLVVDMDFRRPNLGRLLKTRGSVDLVDYFTGKASLEKVVLPTNDRNLSFIDSVHTRISLSRVVRSEDFDAFLARVKKIFDVVIFDTPPLGMFIDAAILASKLDGAVMVVAENRVEMEDARGVLDQLDKGGVRMLGVVLNFQKPQKHRGYYYGKKYGYYDSDGGRGNSRGGDRRGGRGRMSLLRRGRNEPEEDE